MFCLTANLITIFALLEYTYHMFTFIFFTSASPKIIKLYIHSLQLTSHPLPFESFILKGYSPETRSSARPGFHFLLPVCNSQWSLAMKTAALLIICSTCVLVNSINVEVRIILCILSFLSFLFYLY